MSKLLIFAALLGLGYWYWSGHQREPAEAADADRLTENAATMQRCINQEQRMQSVGGLAGFADVGSSGPDAESLCAEKYGFFKRDGHWYSNQD